MSFSTDLDAVRERAGLPVIYRVRCLDGDDPLITINRERADIFVDRHLWCEAGDAHIVRLEGPGRFRIKRFPLGSSTDPVWPWRVTDAERPAVFGRARTHAAAVELIGLMQANPGQHAQVLDDDDEVLAYITGHPLPRGGVPTRHINAPCSLVPILKPEPGSILDRERHLLSTIEVPPCWCGSVDKYGDDIGEHSPSCKYHLAALELTRMGVDDEHLNVILKRARRHPDA